MHSPFEGETISSKDQRKTERKGELDLNVDEIVLPSI